MGRKGEEKRVGTGATIWVGTNGLHGTSIAGAGRQAKWSYLLIAKLEVITSLLETNSGGGAGKPSLLKTKLLAGMVLRGGGAG